MGKARSLLKLLEFERMIIVGGDTFPIKDTLKSLNLSWDGYNKVWHRVIAIGEEYNFIKNELSKYNNIIVEEISNPSIKATKLSKLVK